MNQELAKKLKEAGYPSIVNVGWDDGFEEHLTLPTLSELIEACGDSFKNLKRASNGYYLSKIYKWQTNNGMGGKQIYGQTPEEAVANLWLELQTNK